MGLTAIHTGNNTVTLGPTGNDGTGIVIPDTGTTVRVWLGPEGMQQKDLGVINTNLQYGNHFYVGGQQSTGGFTAPPSLTTRTTAPEGWGTLTWPPFNPASPDYDHRAIPAGAFFINGLWPDSTVPSGENPSVYQPKGNGRGRAFRR
jgi:hypothetical protein